MRILLVMPSTGDEFYGGVAPLSLATLAGLTPPDVEVRYADTARDELDYDSPVDLVAITVLTQHAPNAYAIATQFRLRGVPVVLGGIHPSAVPEEALRFADAVVVGEAEGVWPRVLEDVRRGRLERTYRTEGLSDLRTACVPRLDIFPAGRYGLTNLIQATRGCPFDCEFCSVTRHWGRTYRHKPIEQVQREIESLPRRDGLVLFVDDNIAGDPRHARALFQAIAPYGLRWMSQASTTMAMDDELLALAAASGCRVLLIGLESTDPDNLAAMGKRVNRVDQYAQQIARIQSHGIAVYGCFMFGYDYDDRSAFEAAVRFAEEAHLEFAQFFIVMPFPGSRLRERLEQEGRIVDSDWSHYTGARAVHQPRLLSPADLEAGREWAVRRFHSTRSVYRRVIRGPQPWRRNKVSLIMSNLALSVQRSRGRSGGPAGFVASSATSVARRLSRLVSR